MNLFKKVSCRAFNVLFLIVFAYLFIAVAVCSGSSIAFFAFACFALIALFLNFVLPNDEAQKDKFFYLFVLGCALILLIGQFFVCANNIIIPRKGDYEAIYTGVKELVNYGKFTDSAAYFLAYPHQLFSTFCFAVINRIFVILGSSEPVNVLLTAYAISFFNAIGLFCCAIGAKLLFGKKQAIIATVLLCLNLNNYTGSTFLYAHSLSLAVLGPVFLAFAFALKQQKTILKSVIAFIILGVSLAVAQSMEGIFVIGLVAVLIFIFMHFSFKESLIKAGGIIIGFVVTLSCFALIYNGLNIFDGIDRQNKSLPYEHWIMIGLSEGGKYNEEDYTFSMSLPDTKTRQEKARIIIKQRLADRSFFQLLEHINIKEARNWSSFKYGPEIVSSDKEIKVITGYSLALLLGLVLLALKQIKQSSTQLFMVFQIWAVGIVLFFALWESSAYYLVSSSPVILMAAVAGFAQWDIKGLYSKIKKR